MTNVVDIRTREDVSATRPGISGEARDAVARLLCPYGVTIPTVDLFLALLWSQGFRVERVPGPPVERPCDSEDDGA